MSKGFTAKVRDAVEDAIAETGFDLEVQDG